MKTAWQKMCAAGQFAGSSQPLRSPLNFFLHLYDCFFAFSPSDEDLIKWGFPEDVW